MRTFRIDCNLADPFPDGKHLGSIGERNAAQLVITPPAEMAENENIAYYVAAFSTNKGAVRIGPYLKAETITVPVVSALTTGYLLAFQLEGFDSANEILVKSEFIHSMEFGPAVRECHVSDGAYSGEDKIIEGHAHENLSLLDKLGESNGNLLYADRIIPAKKLRTVELLYSNGDINGYCDTEAENSFQLIVSEGKIPEGSEIESIEIKIIDNSDSSDWVNLKDMLSHDQSAPYCVHLGKPFYIDSLKGDCIGSVYFLRDNCNKFHNAIFMGDMLVGARVTYSVENGVE